MLRQFDDWMAATGLADATRHTYRYQLVLLWCDFLYAVGVELHQVSEALLDAYLAGMDPRGSKRGDAMRAMKACFRWMQGRVRPDDPTAHMVVPRAKITDAPDLTDESLRLLLRALFRREPRRGWATMLCFATGTRVTALVHLVPTDVDLRRSRITFRVTKNDRPYAVPLNRMGWIAAGHLVADARASGRSKLVGVGAERFRQWLHAAEAEAGLPRVWPHLLRHAASNRWAESGDVEAWRKLGNWSDLSQWSRYVHADEDRLRDAALRSMLRA